MFDEIMRMVRLECVSLLMIWCILVFVLMLMFCVGLLRIRMCGLVVSYLVRMIFCWLLFDSEVVGWVMCLKCNCMCSSGLVMSVMVLLLLIRLVWVVCLIMGRIVLLRMENFLIRFCLWWFFDM